ncbi:unnamed protein product [Peronospora belbahrii]|uniref:Transmembrane protein n=1 Tax=Peronospora belbahrii TaxID=622444 RepID=A0ABN8CUK2_9STRA|nr:unnamed protein product [Peronospora belbahrii]
MQYGLLVLVLVVFALMTIVSMAHVEPEEVEVDMDGGLLVEEEEMLNTADETDSVLLKDIDPRLTPEGLDKIFSKLSAKCFEQVQKNPSDATKVSDRCRGEVASRIQRYLARLDKEASGEMKDKKKTTSKKKKRRGRKSKKQTRAHREAVAAQKEEEYQKTLQIIVGFVVTLVAIIASAMFFINRKLKDAGMYFPDPDAKATCCN